MQATQKGFILALATFIMWGVFPIFFKFIEGIAATEVLAHRIIWSALILLVILIITKRLNSVKRIAKIKKVTLTLAITGALIASNWGVFIYAINQNEILATSLGYFINPLFFHTSWCYYIKRGVKSCFKTLNFYRIYCYWSSNLRHWQSTANIYHTTIIICIIWTFTQKTWRKNI